MVAYDNKKKDLALRSILVDNNVMIFIFKRARWFFIQLFQLTWNYLLYYDRSLAVKLNHLDYYSAILMIDLSPFLLSLNSLFDHRCYCVYSVLLVEFL